MLDLIASFLVRGLNVFFHMMPIRFNLWLGRRFGTLLYFLSGRRNRVAYANLKAAFCGEKTPEQIERITRSVYRHMAQTFVEILSMTKFDRRYIEKFVTVRNMERIRAAAENPKGMILISAHFGNWELSTVTSVMKGFPLYLLAREQKMKRLNELLNLLRESKGNIVIRKGADIRSIFRILRDGKSVGILADQNAGTGGQLVSLFGRSASTAVGPYRFAQKSGAWILPAFIHRVKGPYHELVLESPMIIGKDDDIVPYMRKYNLLLEKHIRAHPDQWLWMHKKWKMTPVKKIMVLDDGKRGHLKQSLAVVKQLRRYREAEGYLPGHTEVDIVRIRFKNRMARVMFNILRPVFLFSHRSRLGCLRMALKRESYEIAVNRYADVIISCGAALAGVNLLLKAENYARNLAVLDPGMLSRGGFNLVVLPRHDLPGSRFKKDNIIVTDLAPNLIEPDEIISLRKEMEKTGKPGIWRRPCMGLLFGGDNPCFVFGEDLARSISEQIRKACGMVNGCFYATTSRRTPTAAERILKESFADDPACVGFVSGKDDRDERTVEKIFAASDIVIVSGESISMVSEAISSGRPVLVFMPEKKTTRYTKYERFLRNLRQCGYVRCIVPEQIPDEVVRIIGRMRGQNRGTGGLMDDRQRCKEEGNSGEEPRPEVVLPDDNRRIYERMYKLF